MDQLIVSSTALVMAVMVVIYGLICSKIEALARQAEGDAESTDAWLAALLVNALDLEEKQQVILAKLEQIDGLLRLRRPHGTAPFDNGYSPGVFAEWGRGPEFETGPVNEEKK